MEIAAERKYVYEHCENGLKGGLCMEGGNPFAHLSVPIGVIVIREQSSAIPENHYNDYENKPYSTIDDNMFDVFVDKCSQYIRNKNETRRRNLPNIQNSKKHRGKIVIF